jgi:hypothetical protein
MTTRVHLFHLGALTEIPRWKGGSGSSASAPKGVTPEITAVVSSHRPDTKHRTSYLSGASIRQDSSCPNEVIGNSTSTMKDW